MSETTLSKRIELGELDRPDPYVTGRLGSVGLAEIPQPNPSEGYRYVVPAAETMQQPQAEIPLPPSAMYRRGKRGGDGDLWHTMAMHQVAGPDGIDLTDSTPLFAPEAIMDSFLASRSMPDFSIQAFFDAHFVRPVRQEITHPSGMPLPEYSRYCMHKAERPPSTTTGNQLGLRNPSLRPNGRFDVHYNWDSRPVGRALLRMREWGAQMYRNTLDNFSDLIGQLDGNSPNCSQVHSRYRSQPNVMPGMVRDLARRTKNPNVLVEYLPAMESHHLYWREGADDPTKLGTAPGSLYRRVRRMRGGEVMCGHHDDGPREGLGPRDEMYREDYMAFKKYQKKILGRPATADEENAFYTNRRAGAEHGEDYTGAVFKDGKDPLTIHVVDLAPVKCNALMFQSAEVIAEAYRVLASDKKQDVAARAGYAARARYYQAEADSLADSIEKYCVAQGPYGDIGTAEDVWLTDYDVVADRQKQPITLSPVFALSVGAIRDTQLASRMLDTLDRRFFRKGGLINSLYKTDEQWDNAVWPIMQLEAVDAAVRYGRFDLAYKWCKVFLTSNDEMYRRLGHLGEKSHPDRPGYQAGNNGHDLGEYPCVQDLLMSHAVNIELRAMQPWLKRQASLRAKRLAGLSQLSVAAMGAP